MGIPDRFRAQLRLPAVCAPMFLVSTPALVREACLAGLLGGLPRQNARTLEEFEAWLREIDEARARALDAGRPAGVLAVNLASSLPPLEMAENLELCKRYRVEVIINAVGNPTELTRRAHDLDLLVYADAISMRFAEKAISAGVDGITAIGAGGGGHSGTISHFALVPKLRRIFGGTIVLAGAVSTGAGIRAAECLGADLTYLGTRFIATTESGAPAEYRDMLVTGRADDLMYTPKIAGVAANWLVESMRRVGLDPTQLPEPTRKMGHDHLPAGVKPWRNLWSAGQGIELIDDVPTVRELVERLIAEYQAACATPAFKYTI